MAALIGPMLIARRSGFADSPRFTESQGGLRQLAKRWKAPVERTTASGGAEPKKADMLNAELAEETAYSSLIKKV